MQVVVLRSFGVMLAAIITMVVFASSVHGDGEDGVGRRLQFNQDGKFKVVQFTDLHFGVYEDDIRTLAVQGTVLTKEKPDLVVITGDLVSGYRWNGKDKNWFYNHWRQLVEPMASRNIRWIIALGNHDREADLTGEEVIDLDRSHPLSLTQLGPSSIGGSGNYHIPIYLNSTSNETGQVLWVFDSGHNGCMGVSGWGCVESSQVDWYKNESTYFYTKNNHVTPGVAFFHIPLYEHLDLWNSKPVYGNLGEEVGVCCSSVNTGLYSAMFQRGDITQVFCGHDHNNDYYGDYNGINLGYGRKSGYGGYGPPAGWKHGARVIEITANQHAVKTWLRLEDGSVEYQSLHQPSTQQYVGCCDMEGHGRESVSVNALYLYLFNAVWFLLAVLCVFVCRLVYNKCKRAQKKEDETIQGTPLDPLLWE